MLNDDQNGNVQNAKNINNNDNNNNENNDHFELDQLTGIKFLKRLICLQRKPIPNVRCLSFTWIPTKTL